MMKMMRDIYSMYNCIYIMCVCTHIYIPINLAFFAKMGWQI